MKTYKVTAIPTGKYWELKVPQIERVTQARDTKEIPVMAKDLITIMTGEEDPQIEVEYKLPEEAQNAIRLEKERRRVNAEADEARRTAVRTLHERGMAYRDIGAILGISYQRAQQIGTA